MKYEIYVLMWNPTLHNLTLYFDGKSHESELWPVWSDDKIICLIFGY